MARTVEQIQRDIVALEQTVGTLAIELNTLYGQYLMELGQVLRRQVIQTVYHICTQGYPERFLQLSLTQRQTLQQAIQTLARQTQDQLSEPQRLVELAPTSMPLAALLMSAERSNTLQFPVELENAVRLEGSSEFPTSMQLEDLVNLAELADLAARAAAEDEVEDEDEDEDEGNAENEDNGEAEEQAELTAPSQLSEHPIPKNQEPQEPPLTFDMIKTPTELGRWQETLERGVSEVLQTLSHQVNQALQRDSILPAKLPDPVLEVAAKASMGDATAGPPNILNLIVETDPNGKKSAVTHVMAIRLRLSELEFGDATLTHWRSQIRVVLNRLSQLKQEYQKRQREKAIAEAEAAWRSSWYEQD